MFGSRVIGYAQFVDAEVEDTTQGPGTDGEERQDWRSWFGRGIAHVAADGADDEDAARSPGLRHGRRRGPGPHSATAEADQGQEPWPSAHQPAADQPAPAQGPEAEGLDQPGSYRAGHLHRHQHVEGLAVRRHRRGHLPGRRPYLPVQDDRDHADLGPGDLGPADHRAAPEGTKAAGYLALNARTIPDTGSVIDHVVIGPGGIFTLDSQKMDKRLPVRAIDGKLFHGPNSAVEKLDHARYEAEQAAALIGAELGHKVRVRPAMVVYGPKLSWVIMRLKGVDVFDGGHIGSYFRKQSKATRGKHLDTAQIAMVFSAAAHALPPSAERPDASSPGPLPTACGSQRPERGPTARRATR